MSHELRTPLNAILGFAQLLEFDYETPLTTEQLECVSEISKAGKLLLELINEVLDLAKIENGKITMSIEPVQVCDIIEESVMLMLPLAAKKNVEIFELESGCSNEYVLADALRIKQVVINLLSNAIKYNKDNGKVYLTCERIGDKIWFQVTDTGNGIPEEHLQKIFEPFHRLNATEYVEGTGVGLAVVTKLMALMNGTIHVESQEGIGSTFTIVLPVAQYSAEANNKGIEKLFIGTEQSREMNHKKILYIEDNPANLRLVEHIISHLPNLQLLSATRGQMGIDIAKTHNPALILVDINLPDFDGYEVLKRLKTYEETKHIPVIAISASAMKKDIEKGQEVGFADYITKPVNVLNFVNIIKKYTDDNLYYV